MLFNAFVSINTRLLLIESMISGIPQMIGSLVALKITSDTALKVAKMGNKSRLTKRCRY